MRLTSLVALAFALSVGVTEAAKPKTSSKPVGAGKPTVTKTQAPKGGAAQGTSVKTKGASAKTKGPSVKAKGTEAKAPKTTTTSVKAAKTDKKFTTTTAAVPPTTTTTTPGSIDYAGTS